MTKEKRPDEPLGYIPQGRGLRAPYTRDSITRALEAHKRAGAIENFWSAGNPLRWHIQSRFYPPRAEDQDPGWFELTTPQVSAFVIGLRMGSQRALALGLPEEAKPPAQYGLPVGWAASLQALLNDAVDTDGSHHKQWFLEQVADLFGMELPEHDAGIAP